MYLFCWTQRKIFWRMWETEQFRGTIDFHSIFFSYYGSQWCPKTAWLQTFFKIFSFVFGRTKKFIQVWNYLRVSKWWQNFHFWVNYPFNWVSDVRRTDPQASVTLATTNTTIQMLVSLNSAKLGFFTLLPGVVFSPIFKEIPSPPRNAISTEEKTQDAELTETENSLWTLCFVNLQIHVMLKQQHYALKVESVKSIIGPL